MLSETSIVDTKTLTFAQGPAAQFGLTANGRTHQQSPLTSYKRYQYITYYGADRHVCIGRRKLPKGQWEIIHVKDHHFNTNDSHNTAVIGICAIDGTIHKAFDNHASQLNYRISKLKSTLYKSPLNPKEILHHLTVYLQLKIR
ncbi:MAG: BNR-4 repeat-containing protein [Akkermansiaceae bacterium]